MRILLLLFALAVNGDLVYECGTGNQSSITIYSESKWDQNFNFSYPVNNYISLVPLNNHVDLFNYCDLNQYSKDGVNQILNFYNITSSMQWVAILDMNNQRACPIKTFYSKYIITWSSLLVKNIQDTGAIGLLSNDGGSNSPPGYSTFTLLSFKGTLNDTIDQSDFYIPPSGINAGPTQITITNGIVYGNDMWDMIYLLSIQRKACKIMSMVANYNWWVVLTSPYGVFRVTMTVLSAISSIQALFAFYLIVSVIYRSYLSKWKKIYFIPLLVVCPELLTNSIRCVALSDPFSIFATLNYFTARFTASLFNSISIFTKFALLLVWYDAALSIENSFKGKLRKPVFVNNAVIKTFLFSLFSLCVIFDVSCTFLEFIGYSSLYTYYAVPSSFFLSLILLQSFYVRTIYDCRQILRKVVIRKGSKKNMQALKEEEEEKDEKVNSRLELAPKFSTTDQESKENKFNMTNSLFEEDKNLVKIGENLKNGKKIFP